MMERTETSEWGLDPTKRRRAGIRPYTPGTRKMVYVAGKYRDKRGEYHVLRNILAAQEVGLELARMNMAPFIPHGNSFLCNGALADDYDWLDIDREILVRCDGAVFIPGWRESEGALCEREFAETNGIPCFDWDSKVQREFLEMAGHDDRTFEELMEDNHA